MNDAGTNDAGVNDAGVNDAGVNDAGVAAGRVPGGRHGPPFPFSAVVGQEDLRLALVLAAVDPAIGGVLLRGQKGSAKTTLARGLAAVLPGDAPFVELPVGASEDRVVGTIDLRAALTGGERRVATGLLAAAHGGVLYVDEVNLLPDHLVDVLLDVAASGVNRIEREGMSHVHPARFVLLGSMNPEEGELRPQLLDRFGLSAQVVAPSDPALRAEAVRRRLAFDADPEGFAEQWRGAEDDLRTRLAAARPAPLAKGLVEQVAALCVAVGAEGLRADLVCCRAAAALAGWEGTAEAGEEEVRRVAHLALGHRRRRSPFEAPGVPEEELAEALDRAFGRSPGGGRRSPEDSRSGGHRSPEDSRSGGHRSSPSYDGRDPGWHEPGMGSRRGERRGDDAGGPSNIEAAGWDDTAHSDAAGGEAPGAGSADSAPRGTGSVGTGSIQTAMARATTAETGSGPGGDGERPAVAPAAALGTVPRIEARGTPVAPASVAAGRRSTVTGPRGRLVGVRVPDGPVGSVAVAATVAAAVERTPPGTAIEVRGEDLREAVRQQRSGNLVVLAVDASGSMGVDVRMAAAKGAVLSLLLDAYQRRDRVALVTFRGEGAEVVLRPTGSVEVARARLEDLPTGGRTPLAAGIATALDVAEAARGGSHPPLLVLVTDGRATAAAEGVDPLVAATEAAALVRRRGVPALVVDAEDGAVRLGLASQLAAVMGATYLTTAHLSAEGLVTAVRGTLPGGGG